MTPRAPRAAAAGRDERVDALRALAAVAMAVALCGPGGRASGAVTVVQFLAAPLFALLIGMGAQLGDRGARGLPMAFVRAGLRAGALVAVGLWLTGLAPHVDILLLALAGPTLLAPVIARLPSRVVAVLALACWAAAPTMRAGMAPHLADAVRRHDELGRRLWEMTFEGAHYRLPDLLVLTCLGVLIQRLDSARVAPGRRLLWAIAALAGAGVLLFARASGRVPFEAFTGSRPGLAVNALMAGGVALAWSALLPSRVALGPLATAGAMTLSSATGQTLYLAGRGAGEPNQSWTDVGVLVAIALLLPWVWQAAVTAWPWRKGPLEGPITLVTGLFDERR